MEWQTAKRIRVMIVDTDWTLGIKLADWLAAHGYQPVLHRSYDVALNEVNSIRPEAIIIAVDSCCLPEQADVSELLFRLQTVCPDLPIIGIADTITESVALFGDHSDVQLLVKPVDFVEVERLLRSGQYLATV